MCLLRSTPFLNDEICVKTVLLHIFRSKCRKFVQTGRFYTDFGHFEGSMCERAVLTHLSTYSSLRLNIIPIFMGRNHIYSFLMRKFLFLFLSLLFVVANAVDAKEKTIRNYYRGTYKGEVDKNNNPHGNGVLRLGRIPPSLEISGNFNSGETATVSDATVLFPGNFVFRGNVELYKSDTFKLYDGVMFNGAGEIIGTIPKELAKVVKYSRNPSTNPLQFDDPIIMQCAPSIVPNDRLKHYTAFAKDATRFSVRGAIPVSITASGLSFNPKPDSYEVVFSDGTIISVQPNGIEEWTKPAGKDGRGDHLTYRNNQLLLSKYCVHFGEDYVSADGKGNYYVRHRFSNGNVYEGPVLEDFSYSVAQSSIKQLRLEWGWTDLYKWIVPSLFGYDDSKNIGTITYADNSRYHGSFKSNRYPYAVGDKLSEDCYLNGTLYNSEGLVEKVFQNGVDLEKRDELLAQAKLKEEQEKKELQDNIEKEYQMLCRKYGAKYVDSLLESRIEIGTPEALLLEYVSGAYKYVYYKENIRNYFRRKYDLYSETRVFRSYYLYNPLNERITVDIHKPDNTVSRVFYPQ